MNWLTKLFKRNAMPVLPIDDRSRVEKFHADLVEAMREEWLEPMSAEEYRLYNYGENDNNAWCGDTVATAARKCELDPEMAKRIIRSTYRMASDEFADSRYAPDLVPLRRVPIGEMKPGHIVTFKTSPGKEYGDHITVPYFILHDKIYCYDGNARGLLSTGEASVGRSVVKSVRDIEDVCRVWEVLDDHLIGNKNG